MGSTNEELIAEFGDALDEWAGAVREACRAAGVQHQQLAGRMTELTRRGTVTPSRVSKWLSGRRIVTSGGAGLPGRGVSRDIVRALGLEGARAQRLMRLGERIDLVQAQLERRFPGGWRVAAQAHLLGQSTAAATGRGVNGAEAALPETALPDAALADAALPDAALADAALPDAALADAALPEGSRPERHGPSWRGQPVWAKALGGAAAVAATATVLATAALLLPADEQGGPAAGSRSGTERASSNAAAVGGPPARPEATKILDLEKGTLGEDSRCSSPFPGPEAITWRVCTRVGPERISFALKITNGGGTASAVRIRLEYARLSAFHPCPQQPGTRSLDVPAGGAVITDPEECTVPRDKTPFAYQAVGWVVAQESNGGSYELSPTAHVYPDRVIWKPDLV
ncbi:hypothetical protein [Streptomyces sp. NBC_00045]|uniref:hypothetical protein n=1 Tax=Streptomyces sp. NBC_00045 TaxID=2975625 RepID=UPI003246F224